jgi:hypothetical protein
MKSIEVWARELPGDQTADRHFFDQTTGIASSLASRSTAYPAIPTRSVSAVRRLAISVSHCIHTVYVRRLRITTGHAPRV